MKQNVGTQHKVLDGIIEQQKPQKEQEKDDHQPKSPILDQGIQFVIFEYIGHMPVFFHFHNPLLRFLLQSVRFGKSPITTQKRYH